jgi:hypothetical protein
MTDFLFQKTDYIAIRKAIIDLHQRILKTPTSDEIKTCARHLGLLHKKTLVFKNDTETDLLTDYMIYSYRPKGFNMAEKFLRLNKGRLSELDQALLFRMSFARYSVIKIKDIGKKCEINVIDIFLNTEFTLVDKQLSKSVGSGFVIAGHIIDLGQFSIQSGASLPVDKPLMMAEEVQRVLQNIGPNSGDHFLLHPANNAKFARATITAAIRLGYTDNVSYSEV